MRPSLSLVLDSLALTKKCTCVWSCALCLVTNGTPNAFPDADAQGAARLLFNWRGQNGIEKQF
jgi:hypothetical protein